MTMNPGSVQQVEPSAYYVERLACNLNIRVHTVLEKSFKVLEFCF